MRLKQRVFLFSGALKPRGREESDDSQPPIAHEWGGAWVVPRLRWRRVV
jgi:hypothetical protein